MAINENYDILFLNDAAREQYGDRDARKNEKCYRVSHGYDRPCENYGEDCPIKALFNDPSLASSSVQHIHQGSHFIVNASRSRDDKNLFIEEHINITEFKSEIKSLKQAIEDARFFKDFFYSNPYIMLLFDPGGMIIKDANDAAVKYYGYSKEELIGKTIQSTVNPSISGDVVSKHADLAMKNRQKVFLGFKHILKSGEERNVEVSLSPVLIAGKTMILATILDVTDKFIQEQRLVRSNADLSRLNLFYSVLSKINSIEENDEVLYLKKVIKIIADIKEIHSIFAGRLDENLNVEPIGFEGQFGDELYEFYKGEGWKEKSIGVEAIKSKKFAYTNNYSSDKRTVTGYAPQSIISSVGVLPLAKNGTVWGIVAFVSAFRNLFSREIIRVIGDISFLINRTLTGINSKEKEKKFQRELLRINLYRTMISESIQLMMKEREKAVILKEICKIIAGMKEISFVSIALWNGKRIMPSAYYSKIKAAIKIFKRLTREDDVNLKDKERCPYFVTEAFRTGSPVIINDYKNPEFIKDAFAEFIKSLNAGAVAAIPIKIGGENEGVLFIYAEKNTFTQEIIGLLKTLADDISFKLSLLKLEEGDEKQREIIEHLAYHDILTTLPNRAAFMERIKAISSRSKRHNLPFSMIEFDLDGFKTVNDTMGHDAGDNVLSSVAERIKGILRAEDVLFRIGGDEFVVLMDTIKGAEDLLMLSSRIIREINLPINVDGKEIRIGASVGIALNYDGKANIEELFKAADNAMYEAKKKGGSRDVLVQI